VNTKYVQLNLRLFEADENGGRVVLIEGDQTTLEWFGNLILKHATGVEGCGLQMFPTGPGSTNFALTSTLGFYLHRQPCDHPTAESETQAGQ
jgi:hypothetical protein